MPSAKMSGTEFAGRLIALEAVVTAIAGESLALLPPDKAATLLATIKEIAHARVDDLAPEFSSLPPNIKEIDQHAGDYVDHWVDVLGRTATKIRTDAAAKESR